MAYWGYEIDESPDWEAVIPMKPIVRCIISSSDKNLINSAIIVNVHPDTKAIRIVQYVYELVHDKDTPAINEFALKYNENVLSAYTPLSDLDEFIDFEGYNALRLNFDLYHYQDDIPKLEYDYTMDFMYGDFDVEINLLSKNDDKQNNPIITLKKARVPLSTSGARLQKVLLEDIKDLESDKNTLCYSKDGHTIEDFMGFKIKGHNDNMIVKLRDENGRINDNFLDSSLSDILGINFMPDKFVRFTLMFYIHHEYDYSSNGKLLSFISDIPSLYDRMSIHDDTTVTDIKEYIIHTCLVHRDYDIPLCDITLLYQGQRVLDHNPDGTYSLIKDYIGDNKTPAVHVQTLSVDSYGLNQANSFWYQRFKFAENLSDASIHSGNSDEIKILNPNDDEVVNSIDNWEDDDDDDDDDYVPSESSSASFNHHQNFHDIDEDVIDHTIKYKTESGQKIEILDGLYRKCIINDCEHAFINTKYLEPQHAKLRFKPDGSDTMQEISLDSMRQYALRSSSNRIDLDDYLINQLESRLHMTIVPEEVEEVPELIDNIPPPLLLRNRLISRVISGIYVIGVFIFLILKTLYYVVITNFMIFMLLSELAFFVPLKVTGLILGLVILRTIMVNEDVRNSWIEFFHLDRYNVKNLEKISNFVEADNLTIEFYSGIAYKDYVETPNNDNNNNNNNNKSVLNKLFRYPEFHTAFYNIMESNGLGEIEPNLVERLSNDPNFVMTKATQVTKAWKELVLFYIIILKDIDHHNEVVNKREFIKDMNELLGHIETEMYKNKRIPWKTRLINGVQNWVRRVRNINWGRQILEYIVPNPLRDNIILSILKNVILFVLLLVPLINFEVDKIVKERKEAIDRQRAKLREQQELHDESQPPVTDEGIATGVELEQYHDEE